jgi:hypothetical protein
MPFQFSYSVELYNKAIMEIWKKYNINVDVKQVDCDYVCWTE